VIDFCDFGEDDLQVAGVAIEDLSWRVHKLRLEEENKRRFLKAKPRFLPYNECRKWVQAFGRWKSETEWWVPQKICSDLCCGDFLIMPLGRCMFQYILLL